MDMMRVALLRMMLEDAEDSVDDEFALQLALSLPDRTPREPTPIPATRFVFGSPQLSATDLFRFDWDEIRVLVISLGLEGPFLTKSKAKYTGYEGMQSPSTAVTI